MADLHDFGWAINRMKQGYRVQRLGWNGKGMHIYLDTRSDVRSYEPCIVMYTAQGRRQPGWLASQADMLAIDWAPVIDEPQAGAHEVVTHG